MEFNFVLDVDGVMTTGQFGYTVEGKAFKIFGPHDSEGLELLRDKANIYFISADERGFAISKRRIDDLNYPLELVSERERLGYVKDNFGFKNTIYMGDGISDAPLIQKCFFGIAPSNAREEAKRIANYVTPSKSAEGAVCDACIEILRRLPKWNH